MACREGISDPSSAILAVTKTKDISCDGASEFLSRLKNFCHHVLAVSLVKIAVTVRHICSGVACCIEQSYSCLKTCRGRVSVTRLVKIAATLRHVYRLLDIRRSPMSHWAQSRHLFAPTLLAPTLQIMINMLLNGNHCTF